MKFRSQYACILIGIAACGGESATSPDLAARMARGGGGPPSSSGKISGISLADPRRLDCSHLDADALNNTTPTTVAGWCMSPDNPRPFVWNAATGSTVVGGGTGFARGVSDYETVVGDFNGRPFYRTADGTVHYFPSLSSSLTGSAAAISADGTHAVGSAGGPVLWTRTGSSWVAAPFPGWAQELSADGSVIVGHTSDHAAVWTHSAGVWTHETLPDNGALRSIASGVTADGAVIAGNRDASSFDPGSPTKDAVVWLRDGSGAWSAQILQRPGGVGATASAVEYQNDGSLVVVGSYNVDSNNSIGLAWRRPVGALSFGSPVTLEPYTKGATSYARDVNVKGEIIGGSGRYGGSRAMMWKLP